MQILMVYFKIFPDKTYRDLEIALRSHEPKLNTGIIAI